MPNRSNVVRSRGEPRIDVMQRYRDGGKPGSLAMQFDKAACDLVGFPFGRRGSDGDGFGVTLARGNEQSDAPSSMAEP